MVTNGTHSAHCPDLVKGCGLRQCGLWGCRERQRAHLTATFAAAQEDERPVGMAGGVTLQPTAKRGDDLTADFMALAGSHMATTKVLARLVFAARKRLGPPGRYGDTELLAAIEAAEKDLGL